MVVHVKKESAQLQVATVLAVMTEIIVKLTSTFAQMILASLEDARKVLVQRQAVSVTLATLVIHATYNYRVYQTHARMVALVYPNPTVILSMPVSVHLSTQAMTVKQSLVVENILTAQIHYSAKSAAPVIHILHMCHF